MKKIVSIFLILTVTRSAYAQRTIDGLIQAERNFAAFSVAKGTRDAFLKFADSMGIVFENGKPVNAIETWTKREKRPGTLNWWPEFAEIAASGDLGYTTGPWTFTLNDTVRAAGYYNSIWHINNGEWKFVVDLGVGNTSCDFAKLEMMINQPYQADKGTEVGLRAAEETLIARYRQNAKPAYKAALSQQSRVYRNGWCVATGSAQQQRVIDSLPANIQFTINGTGIASTGDIGYVYGTTIVNGKTDNYVRIWRREEAGWKLALEVLRY